jgi:CheY-like chemotaxis protein
VPVLFEGGANEPFHLESARGTASAVDPEGVSNTPGPAIPPAGPRGALAAAARAVRPPTVPAPDGPAETTTPELSCRVLVADDNQDAASSLALWLQLHGHEVREVHDGAQALAAIEAFRPRVSILDIGMPSVSGIDVARQVRRQPWGQGMVLIALTGWGQLEDRRRSEEAGFDHHLVKPVDPAALQGLLKEIDRGVPPAGALHNGSDAGIGSR